MAGLLTDGLAVPDCAQPDSLAADGPLTADLDFVREPPVERHPHGLNLAAALNPNTRAEAGVPGPRLPSAQLAHRKMEEPTGPRSSAQQASP